MTLYTYPLIDIQGPTGPTGPTGAFGFTGSQGSGYTGSASTVMGPTGATGAQGDGGVGYQGSQGDSGYTGSQGFTGSVGESGLVGYRGSRGDTGFTGSRGDLGYTGSAGTVGFVGSEGARGFVGYTGSRGNVGFTGSAGVDGYSGSTGLRGFTGYTGSRGDLGFTGSRGDGGIGYTGSASTAVGTPGYTGSRGAVGFTGSRGDLGTVGYTGSSGAFAARGYTGSRGADGAFAAVGYTGSSGAFAAVGYTGSQGFTGSSGAFAAVGYTGSSGAFAAIGYTGSSGAFAAVGYTGSRGADGTGGYTGSRGFTGSSGAGYAGSSGGLGYTGSRGFTGSQGAGFTGSSGGLGFSGSRGFTGSQGAGYTGSVGYVGSMGFTGSTGYTGSEGVRGQQGLLGYSGSQGIGLLGYTGSRGVVGFVGSQGPAGTSGGLTNIPTSSAVAPGLKTEIDPDQNTGLYSNIEATLGISTDGVGRVLVSNNGTAFTNTTTNTTTTPTTTTTTNTNSQTVINGGVGQLRIDTVTTAVTNNVTTTVTNIQQVAINANVDAGINAGVAINSDGNLEIVRAAGGAYIDFKNSAAEDYDVRIAQQGNSSTLEFFSGGASTATLNTTELTVTGRVNTASSLYVRAQGGSAGGELQLQLAPSGSTLNGDVYVDTVSNRLRVYEGGGTFRGAFLNISSTAANVGSEIIHSNNINNYLNNTYVLKTGDTMSGALVINSTLSTSSTATFGGNVRIPDGSASSPGLNFTNAANSGIYRTTNGVEISVGGSFAARFSSGVITSQSITNIGTIASIGEISCGGGANNIRLTTDAGIEITRGAGDAFIDFKNSSGEDYDVRIGQLGSSNTLQVSGVNLSTGNLQATGNITAFASDQRLKENIQIIPDALDKVHQIKGITFDWNSLAAEVGFKPTRVHNEVGVLAQEIQAVLPQAVSHAPFDQMGSDNSPEIISRSGEYYLTVQYEKIVPLLIEAIKQLDLKVQSLTNKLNKEDQP